MDKKKSPTKGRAETKPQRGLSTKVEIKCIKAVLGGFVNRIKEKLIL